MKRFIGIQQGTAVHWHGIRLPNAMDGVPMLTQDIQEPYTDRSYEFVPPDAGIYWYHSHYNSQEQVARGLIGPLIVEETSKIDVDEDITIILSDWLMNNDGQLIEEFSDMHSVAHAGFMGNYARAIFSQTKIHMGDRVRLRLINAATNRIFPLKLSGVDGKIVSLDGMALDTPRDFENIIIAPAQRVDLILDVSDNLIIDQLLRDGFFQAWRTTDRGIIFCIQRGDHWSDVTQARKCLEPYVAKGCTVIADRGCDASLLREWLDETKAEACITPNKNLKVQFQYDTDV